MRRQSPPDAICCANDLASVGCYEALKSLGLEVGRDVAVIGYDHQEIAQHLDPPLSTVLLPHREMGEWCVRKLFASGPLAPGHERIECPVVPRASHGAR